MPNNLFNSTQNNNIMSEFNRFQNNPMQWLMNRNVNIPQEYANNPEQAVQYLLNNGKMSQGTLNQIIQQAKMFGFKI